MLNINVMAIRAGFELDSSLQYLLEVSDRAKSPRMYVFGTYIYTAKEPCTKLDIAL